MTYLIGVDGGGTGCRAVVANEEGDVLGKGQSGSANINTDLEGSAKNIMAAIDAAFGDAGKTPDYKNSIAVMGLAGANLGDYPELLGPRLPFTSLEIVNDGHTAHDGALNGGDGTLAIVGTGSIFALKRDGDITTIGGWGFDVGDLSSGARLGHRLLQESLLANDGVRPETPLSKAIIAHFHGAQGLVAFAKHATPGDYGTFAPMILDHEKQGDALAEELVAWALADLDAAIRTCVEKAPGPVSFLGGLGKIFAKRLTGYDIVEAHGTALDGAILRAQRML
ncbi:BadF/BadG/BcrA/BcrD ATPase family protein [Paracoccaceae bacterium GXU_MW_L88]